MNCCGSGKDSGQEHGTQSSSSQPVSHSGTNWAAIIAIAIIIMLAAGLLLK